MVILPEFELGITLCFEGGEFGAKGTLYPPLKMMAIMDKF